jgi:phage baseplate assembly protein W|tara:strand:- start:2391 stop:2918 length:528 start_codon:yes stop_codon:yes gene_type:complete
MSRLSIKTPLSYDDVYGPYTPCEKMKEVAYQNLKTLALTNPGERIWDSNFGIGLRKRLFENDSDPLRSSIKMSIANQINSYIPFVQLIAIDFKPQNDANQTLSISIIYAIVSGAYTSEKQRIVFSPDLGEGVLNQIDESTPAGIAIRAIWDEMHEPIYLEDGFSGEGDGVWIKPL